MIELGLIDLTGLHLYGIESAVNLGVRALGIDCLAAGGSSNVQFFLNIFCSRFKISGGVGVIIWLSCARKLRNSREHFLHFKSTMF
jgi:hypothetical protein